LLRAIAAELRTGPPTDSDLRAALSIKPSASGSAPLYKCASQHPKAPAAARISAASALLDRGYGKPLQTVDANNTNVNYVVSDQPMTEEE
jgi:hypothetical protein